MHTALKLPNNAAIIAGTRSRHSTKRLLKKRMVGFVGWREAYDSDRNGVVFKSLADSGTLLLTLADREHVNLFCFTPATNRLRLMGLKFVENSRWADEWRIMTGWAMNARLKTMVPNLSSQLPAGVYCVWVSCQNR